MHCTTAGVTKLGLDGPVRDLHCELREGDTLPPNVEILKVMSPPISLLLPLKRLRALSMRDLQTIPGDQLQQLSTLQGLQNVSILYQGNSVPGYERRLASSAAAWRRLPVKNIEVWGTTPTAVLPHFAQLLGLTRLAVICQQHTAKQLAASLRSLTKLEKLKLDFDVQQPTNTLLVEENVQVAKAISGLAALRSLKLRYIPLTHSAAEVLACSAAAGQLTQLQVELCGLQDNGVKVIACHCTSLMQLNLCGCKDVSSSVLPVIAKQLQQLTSLDLRHTAVSNTGLHYVSHLKQLGWCGTSISVSQQAKLRSAGVDDVHCMYCPVHEFERDVSHS